MSIIKSILEEELKRNLKNQNSYKQMLKNLPKGSIYISERNGKRYMYRKNRKGKKVINEYICALSNVEKAEEEMNKSSEYHRINNNLKLVKKEEIKLRKAIKGYE